MGDKEAKLRGQVINKPKEQMWMLKSESVSSNLVKWDYKAFFWGIPFQQIQIQPTTTNLINVPSGSGRIQVYL